MTETFAIGDLKFAALGDRVLVQEDEFRSGYECETCKGSGWVDCEFCEGLGKKQGKFLCSPCGGSGKKSCLTCGGKGGILVVPETSQRRPTTGKIVSVGENCKILQVGESVLYSNFAGYVVDLSRAGVAVTLRILHESEIFCRIEGHLEVRSVKSQQEEALTR